MPTPPTSQRRLPLAAWPDALVAGGLRAEVMPRWLGYQVRTDQWRCQGWTKDWHVIYLGCEGEAPGAVDGKPFTLGPGTLLWLPPGTPLDLAWPPTFAFSEVWFKLHGRRSTLQLAERHLLLSDAGSVGPLIEHIADELALPRPGQESRLLALLSLTASECLRLRDRPTPGATLTLTQRTRLMRHLREHLAERPSLEELADITGLSADYFSRLFRRTYGVPPRDWVVRERLRAATRLLAEGALPVHAIADRLGYASAAQFSRQFKAEMGCSPVGYRRR